MTKETQLFSEIKNIIDSAKKDLAVQVNSAMSALYWEIGNRINQDLLKEKRAEYGKQIVSQLAKQLQTEYGSNSFSEKNLRRMMQFASVFPDRKRGLSQKYGAALIILNLQENSNLLKFKYEQRRKR